MIRMLILTLSSLVLVATCYSSGLAAQIHDAAKAGDLEQVKQLLSNDPALIGAVDENTRTPLHWACRGVHVEVVKYLLEKGADVNVEDRNGVTPLHSAASRGHSEATRVLLEKGAVVDRRSRLDLCTALHYAASAGHIEVMKLLLQHGAQAAAINIDERTPLHLAVQGEQASAVEMLMNHIKEVDPALLNLGDFDGNSPLHLACDTHNAAIVSLLLKGTVDGNVRNTIGMTAYNLATERGFEDIADTLIQHGADRSPQQFPTLKGPYFGETPPELTPKLFAKGIVSTSSGRHSSIDFSPNLDEAVWQSGDTLCFMKMENGVWRAPREVPFFKPGYSVDAPFFSADGSRVYLLAGPLDASGISGRLFVWYMDRTRDGWSDPRLLDSVASSVPIHWQASMDKDGNLYTGAGSIYCSRFVNGKYLTPEKLPDIINVVPESAELAGEIGPFISRNGDYLIFNRFNPRPSFEVSFLISFRRSDGSWSEPQNLIEKLGGGGMAARVTPDGKYLFFMSDRPGSARERSIYWVDAKVIEELRPRE